MDRKTAATAILSDVEEEVRATESQIRDLTKHLEKLNAQRTAARILAGLEQSPTAPVQIERVKNMSALTYKVLREQYSTPVSIPDLYKHLRATVGNVGSRTYLYKVVSDLIDEGLVRKDPEGRVIVE